jgi:hypothetical protein
MNTLDVNVTRALDGYAGGIYAPSASIEIDGGGIPSGAALKLRSGASGAAAHLLQTDSQAALFVGHQSNVSQASAPAIAAYLYGTSNIHGAGSAAIYLKGGQGGSGGAGGAGMLAIGGHGTASGYAGGVGLASLGGTPCDRHESYSDYSGAGIYSAGATPAFSSRRGGAGVYGYGGFGASGGYGGVGIMGAGGGPGSGNRGGIGGLFLGYGATGYGHTPATAAGETTAGAGVVGIGGTSNTVTYGVVGLGSSGSASEISMGGYFRGAQGGYGIIAYPGVDTAIAAAMGGAVSLALGSGTDKNPDATTAVNNTLYGKNIVKAWGIVRDGVLIDGFNIASVAIIGAYTGGLEVEIASNMGSADYAVITQGTWGFADTTLRQYMCFIDGYSSAFVDARTAGMFTITQHRVDTWALVNWAESECYFVVLGEQ